MFLMVHIITSNEIYPVTLLIYIIDCIILIMLRHFFSYSVSSLFYISTLITLTFSAIVASKTPNPAEYDLNALQIARAACEVWSLGMAALTLLSELNQMRKYVFYYCN